MVESIGVPKQLNKGLQIRQDKLNKKAKKRASIKLEQEGLVCFVDFSVKVIERINGKYRHPTHTETGHGLQIQNKIFTPDGHYKMVNRSTLKIKKRYEDIPEWVNEYLLEKYQKSKVSFEKKNNPKSCIYVNRKRNPN